MGSGDRDKGFSFTYYAMKWENTGSPAAQNNNK